MSDPTIALGQPSTSNKTETPLAGGATYTGIGEYNNYPDVMVSCLTDADGMLFFDFSVDGTNWNTFPVAGFTVAAGVHEFHTAVKGPRIFRVRLVNGSGAQSYLRLYVYYGSFRQGNAPLNASIGADADATIVRSVDASVDLALGRFGGMIEDGKFGEVYDVDTTSSFPIDIWYFGSGSSKLSVRSDEKNWPSSSGTLYMSSDSASDTDVDLLISYIDADGAGQDLEYTYTAGTTGASLGVAGLDINRVEVVGPSLNVGNMYFAQTNTWTSGAPSTPSDVIATVPAGYGQTQQAAYRVPAGKKMRIKYAIGFMARASGAAGSAEVHILVKKPGGAWVVKRDFQMTTTSPVSKPVAGLVFPAGAQVRATVQDVSDNDTAFTFEWHYDLVDV